MIGFLYKIKVRKRILLWGFNSDTVNHTISK